MYKAKRIYKANMDGDMTITDQIEKIKELSINGLGLDKHFESSLKYDITRTVTNILSNASILYDGQRTVFSNSIVSHLQDIFFALHENGECYLKLNKDGASIESVEKRSGNIYLFDPAYRISKITQKMAATKALEMYGVVTNTMYSVLDERGIIGMFSPAKDTVLKERDKLTFYDAMRNFFGGKKGQNKFALTEIPMQYTGVSIPVKEMELLENEKAATAKVARIYGIQEDMILSGSTFDNKENAIIQTYSDFKGMIYGWINQIEDEIISFRQADKYSVEFTGVPQLQKKANGE